MMTRKNGDKAYKDWSLNVMNKEKTKALKVIQQDNCKTENVVEIEENINVDLSDYIANRDLGWAHAGWINHGSGGDSW